MFVTFIGSKKSVFVTRSSNEMVKYGFDVFIIDPSESGYIKDSFFGKIKRIFFRICYTVNKIFHVPYKNTVFIHTLNSNIIWLVPVLRLFYNKVVLVCYGSDVLRNDKKLSYVFSMYLVNVIAATNLNVLLDLSNKYNVDNNKLVMLRFGLPVFDEIDNLKRTGFDCVKFKEAIGLDGELIIVSLGYNAAKGQRIGDLVEFVYRNYEYFPHVQFVVPLQYGDLLVRDGIVIKCNGCNKELKRNFFVPITDFYDTQRSAMLRLCTDVLINNSESDAFSGTVQEVLYAGNLVLASESLPYKNMPGYNMSIKMYKNINEIICMLDVQCYKKWKSDASTDSESVRDELRSISSWSSVINDWRKLAE